MDRLTTGRRRVRAGSVSVTELITKQARRPESPAAVTASVETPAEAPVDPPAEPAIDPLPAAHRRPPSRGAQLAKLTSLGVATIVLCGAVGFASMITQQRREEARTTQPAAEITGEQALLPSELNRTLPSPPGTSAASPAKPAPVAEPTQSAADTTAPARPEPPRSTTPEPDSGDPAPLTDVALVQRFYELLPSDPGGAFDLISPNLLHSTLGQFLESWSPVRSVDVLSVREQADGVLAVVRMGLSDGGHLQLQQLLAVADSPRRIVGVQLLSAQRN